MAVPTTIEEIAQVKKYEAKQKLAIKQSEIAYKKANNGGDCVVGYSQCVCYAKTLTGHYGVWGNGGRNLSHNTAPVVGAVIIFDYVHVGVITAVEGDIITYTDRNMDYRGNVRHNVKIKASDPSIWKYHSFK